jgi:hypothetical protein
MPFSYGNILMKNPSVFPLPKLQRTFFIATLEHNDAGETGMHKRTGSCEAE